ncbi:hypothetical protein [Aequorivita flava]|uniref:Secreted protein n=1 Tax=Aequorivita flava TaxID=3114371 RepID=A0AB35Z027_9FLAO
MKSLYAIVCLMCFALPTISYTQISVNDLIEDVKKERGDATDSGKDAANTKAMEDFIGDMAKTVNTVTNLPLEQRCLELMHAHHKKLLESTALIDKAGSNCLKKKDALELHSLAVLSAGTQIYCPDEFNSDKIEYAILILYELVKEHCFNTENERVIVILP